jgi:hypothetical protein
MKVLIALEGMRSGLESNTRHWLHGGVMRRSVLNLVAALGCVSMLAIAVAVAVEAQNSGIPRGGPAPLLGVGLPLLGGVLVAVFVARRLRRKE